VLKTTTSGIGSPADNNTTNPTSTTKRSGPFKGIFFLPDAPEAAAIAPHYIPLQVEKPQNGKRSAPDLNFSGSSSKVCVASSTPAKYISMQIAWYIFYKKFNSRLLPAK
jgi:hypothetical protein